MRKPIVLILIGMFAFCCMGAQKGSLRDYNKLTEGDLLFCVAENGNNITDVTQGSDGQKIDHVAIAHRQEGRWYALEAVHRGVCLTPMDSFLVRRSFVIHAQLRDTVGVGVSVRRALRFLGRPYDFNFMPDDSAFYCSELVQKCYRDCKGRLIFQPIPMSFHDKTGKVTAYWKDYYARQGLRVPEGEPGSNPGDLSRNKAVRILGRLRRVID